MAFDYGKDTLGIKNPFVFEGVVILIKGAVICLLGVLLLLDVRATLESASRAGGWVVMCASLLFLFTGIVYLVEGGNEIFPIPDRPQRTCRPHR
jgi:hypothetical protein